MFEFLRLGLKPTVRVQRKRAEAGALLRLCCKHISKKRNAVKRERARQPREFFIAKQMPAFAGFCFKNSFFSWTRTTRRNKLIICQQIFYNALFTYVIFHKRKCFFE